MPDTGAPPPGPAPEQSTGAPPVGSVAEEAARLVEALSWLAREAPGAGGRPRDAGRGGGEAAAQGTAAEGSRDQRRGERHTGPTTGTGTCETCGRSDQLPFACGICPVCRGLAVLRQVRPETWLRLADAADFVAASLREVAAHLAERGGGSGATFARQPAAEEQPGPDRPPGHSRFDPPAQ